MMRHTLSTACTRWYVTWRPKFTKKQWFHDSIVKKHFGGAFMRKRINSAFVLLLALFTISVMIGCASGPKLGSPTPLQQALNALPEVTVAGKNLKFEFGGDAWIAKVDGKNFMAGTFTSEDTANGSILTLKQTHIYSTEQKPGIGGDVGWVKTPGPDISLAYTKGPPDTLGIK
jgi:hypothetical protein